MRAAWKRTAQVTFTPAQSRLLDTLADLGAQHDACDSLRGRASLLAQIKKTIMRGDKLGIQQAVMAKRWGKSRSYVGKIITESNG